MLRAFFLVAEQPFFALDPEPNDEDDEDCRWIGAMEPGTWTTRRIGLANTPIVVAPRAGKTEFWPIIVLGIAAAVAIWCLAAQDPVKPPKKRRRRR